MWVKSVQLQNIRGFINTTVDFSPKLNVIVGENNSGKTTILKSLLTLQATSLIKQDARVGTNNPSVLIKTSGSYEGNLQGHFRDQTYQYDPINQQRTLEHSNTSRRGAAIFPSQEPNNYIYPFLANRKVTSYQEEIKLAHTTQVIGNFQNLYPKIDRISNPDFQPAHDDHVQACKEIIGFRISAVASDRGKKGAYIIHNDQHIPIDYMGEGISNLLALIVDLCIAENKLFLVEEPENDIHPKALKALLKFIEKKSETNQFIITSHSNIVTKFIGSSDNGKVINTKMEFENKIPTSNISYADTQEERQAILEDLGYEMHDFNLWSHWLFLEESSAERIIRDILIPTFAPKLASKLRTFSCTGANNVDTKFEDFNRLFVFLHLQNSYTNKAWVLIDNGDNEKEIIEKMQQMYEKSGWRNENFMQFSEHNFEKYYPSVFSDEIEEVLQITNKKDKRARKSELLNKVIDWSNDNSNQTKEEFEESASEVINILKDIEKQII